MHAGREPKAALRILIIGGAGAFGSRIARLLAETPGLELALGGRSRPRLEAIAAELRGNHPNAVVSALFVDRDEGLEALIEDARIDLVIDAAGPFQGHDYRVAQAAITSGAHYLDLADTRNFVLGFDRLDGAALRGKLVAITGASSVPALSSAAVGALSEGLTVAEIRLGITPGAGAPWGRSVAELVLSQAGKRSERRIAGEWRAVYGWQDLQRRTLRIRKTKTLHRWVSHCDVPDLDGLARRYPAADTITFHAGIEPWFLHLGLWALSWPVRWGRAPDLSRYTDVLVGIARALDRGRARAGGMFAEIVGYDANGRWLRRTWTLVAAPGRGPTVPAMPAALLAQAIARGDVAAGARGAYELIPLSAFEPLFTQHGITTARDETPLGASVFEQILGDKLALLAEPIRRLHDGHVPVVAEGEATVTTGLHPAARVILRAFGFPDAAEALPVRVEITPRKNGEVWRRKFGERRFRSRLQVVGKAKSRRLIERFGPFAFELRLEAADGRLNYILAGARFFGVPLPKLLAPRVTAFERIDEDRFGFDVKIELPRIGLLVHYAGWLVPVQHAGPANATGNRALRAAALADPTWPF